MKWLLSFYFLVIFHANTTCQETGTGTERQQQLESAAESDEDLAAEDAVADELEIYARHPLNLNQASAEALKELNLLTEPEINNLVAYRKIFGRLIHIYELQAVPGWNLSLIKKLLPYITLHEQQLTGDLKSLTTGEQILILRYGTTLERAKGFLEKRYLGNREKYVVKYRYNYKNQVRWGFAGDKDAGEPFFRLVQKTGFDFYSFHLFLKKSGAIETLAIGDFTVNMGQGLIQWQSLAFKKSAAVINIKRQSAVFRPYTATGEFNFFRGAGVTFKKDHAALTLFLSYKNISTHLQNDTVGNISISSFITSGNHRSVNEIRDRKNAKQLTSGAVFRLVYSNWQVSLNTTYHRFSFPLLKKDEPYNLYTLKGRAFIHASVDYSYTIRNLHFFGEIASDQHAAIASVHGLLLSLDRKVDAALLYRNICRRYHSVTGNAFTESSLPNNENGLYTAISFRPLETLSIDAYADLFQFPWLKYRVNAASRGKDFIISISFKPNKRVDLYSRFKSDFKWINRSASGFAIDPLEMHQRQGFRMHANIKLNRQFTLQNRFELVGYQQGEKEEEKEEGVMVFFDLGYKPAFSGWSAHGRIQFFSADSYSSRIYAYESRMPYLFSIPSFYGKGKRYLLNINHRISPAKMAGWKLQCSIGWVQTFYTNEESIGSGFEEIKGNRRSELSLQLVFKKH